jgi:hypothetical protein
MMASSASLIASINASTVRALARRKHVLIFDQHCAIPTPTPPLPEFLDKRAADTKALGNRPLRFYPGF